MLGDKPGLVELVGLSNLAQEILRAHITQEFELNKETKDLSKSLELVKAVILATHPPSPTQKTVTRIFVFVPYW